MPRGVGGVGQVAAGASGEEDFHTRLAVFVEEDGLSPPLGRLCGGHQSRRPAADNCHVPMHENSRADNAIRYSRA